MNRFSIIAAVFAATGSLFIAPVARAAAPGEVGTVAPALQGSVWSVGKPTTITSLRGKVVVLSFWTTQCINCQRTVPYWSGYAKQAATASDFAVLTVHTPEYPGERATRVSHNYATTHGLNVPVLVDNDRKNWNAYNIQFWPTTLVLDKKGVVRGRFEGELNYDGSGEFHKVDALIAKLRSEK